MARTTLGGVRRVARSRYWREDEASQVVAAWRESGEGLTTFAARLGIKPRRLARWARRCAVEDDSPEQGAVGFHPVRVVATQPVAPIEVTLVDGTIVRVEHGVCVEDLRVVLGLLREGC